MDNYFEKINVNPKQWKNEGDCVIRALSKASNKDWLVVYDELYTLGRKYCRMLNSKPIYEKWLSINGFIKYKQPRKSDGKKFTVKEFVNDVNNISFLKGKTFVVSVAHHLTCIEDGKIKDTWNCGQKTIGNYWMLNK